MYNNYYNKNCCVEVELNTPEIEIDLEMGAKGPQGPRGEQGIQGPAGNDAKINNVNTLNIEAGDNITLEQQGNTLKIKFTNDSNYQNATQVQTAINNAIGTALNGSY